MLVTHFILKRKTDHVKIADRRLRFQRKKRVALGPHEVFHIRPGRIDSFGSHIGPFVEQSIEDAQAQMAHGHFINIGKTVSNGQFDLVVVFYDAVPFPADVAGRFTDFAQ